MRNVLAMINGNRLFLGVFTILVLSLGLSVYSVRQERNRAPLTPSSLNAVTVTIEPGMNLADVAALLVRYGLVTDEVYWKFVTSSNFLKNLAVPAPTMEGYVLPGNYSLKTAQNFSFAMAQFTNQRLKTLGLITGSGASSETINDLLVIASVATAESKRGGNASKIIKDGVAALREKAAFKSAAVDEYYSARKSNKFLREIAAVRRENGLPGHPICAPDPKHIQEAYKELAEKPPVD